MRILTLLILVIASLGISYAQRNTVCSQSAGGISHCQGSKFICNDGRVSGSKKTCDADTHGTKKKASKPKKDKQK